MKKILVMLLVSMSFLFSDMTISEYIDKDLTYQKTIHDAIVEKESMLIANGVSSMNMCKLYVTPTISVDLKDKIEHSNKVELNANACYMLHYAQYLDKIKNIDMELYTLIKKNVNSCEKLKNDNKDTKDKDLAFFINNLAN